MNDPGSIPRAQKLIAAGVYGALVLAIALFHRRLGQDFWPPDASTLAPNILASVIQAALLFPVAVLIWPPTRRRLHRFVDHKLDRVQGRLDEDRVALHDRLSAIEASHLAIHRKLDALTPPRTEREP